jgi:protein-disulfide isomerase
MKQKYLFIASAILLLLAFVAGVMYYKNQQTEQAAQSVMQNREALVRFHSVTLGHADAPVHIVEFLDPACEACRAFYPVVKNLIAANPDKIRLTVRYAPFHQGSDDVVKVLEAARKQGKYWETLDALFASQAGWTQHHTAQVALVWPYLDGLGLDLPRLKTDMQAPAIARLIEQDLEDTKTLNVTMTPEFFVNGKPLPSFGYDALKKAVADALSSVSEK